MIQGKRIYVVEDEKDLCDMICRKLAEFQLQTQGFYSGQSAQRGIAALRPDIGIIDLVLPDMDGLELVKELSRYPGTGVIVLTGRGDLSDRVLGLELGADDYMVKPFEPRELVARVHSLLRRMDVFARAFSDSRGKLAKFAGRAYDVAGLTICWESGRSDMLSASEALLLLKFLHAPKRVLSRAQLFDEEIEFDRQPFDRSIDIRVSRLRRKLEVDPKNPQIIKTVYGAGYLLAAEVEWL
ncbi:MAG: response regulator transcription factor [Candidatus Competibacteraceae bacterium]